MVQLPDGSFLSLLVGGQIAPGIVPMARGFVPFSFSGELLRYRFTGGEPSGLFKILSALVQLNTLVPVGAIGEDPFTFTP